MANKGVIIEYDFTGIGGADILFETTRAFLKDLDSIPFDANIEARYLAGGNYQGALAGYFAVVKTKKTAAKAARDLATAFDKAVTKAVPDALPPSFRNFIKTLADKGLTVIISTHADIGDKKVQGTFAPILTDKVRLYHETAATYGSVKWDAWKRACVENGLVSFSTVAVTGSGFGVKSALVAGLASVAVTNARVAYQDFSGADAVVTELNSATAKRILEALRLA